MPLDILLLVIRIAIALSLYVFLGALLFVTWRDVRLTSQGLEQDRRVAGRLVVVEAHDVSLEVGDAYLLRPQTTLGRGATNTVVLPDSFASNEHAHIVLRGGQWWIEDQDSRNGTSVNGVLVEEPVVLSAGDVIGIGRVKLRLELGPISGQATEVTQA